MKATSSLTSLRPCTACRLRHSSSVTVTLGLGVAEGADNTRNERRERRGRGNADAGLARFSTCGAQGGALALLQAREDDAGLLQQGRTAPR